MGRVFACSDLHGMLDLYKQIKEFLQPDDIVYFLGDAGDRGPDSWETVKAILGDPQFVCLMGNHEDMLLRVMRIEMNEAPYDSGSYDILGWNGGAPTLEGWKDESLEQKEYWYHLINEMPDHAEYTNKDGKRIMMSHAGFTPDPEKPNWFGWQQDLIWDRNHFLYGWQHDIPEDWIVIHGHTPIEYLVDDLQWREKVFMPTLPKAFWYSDGHKCDLDQGAFYTFCTVLLDLDTFEEHGFTTDGYSKDAIYD